MNEPGNVIRVTPDVALESVSQFDGPLLIDLDETLYLRNSTEDFLDSAQPALIAYALLRMLEVLRPWRWTGPDTRDVWRVRLILIAFPWVLPMWRRRAVQLGKRFANAPLQQAVGGRLKPPIIVTMGFQSVVTPLVASLGVPGATLIGMRVWHAADRRNGKLPLAEQVLGADTIARSAVVTDSAADLPLLSACARPLLTVWPQAQFRSAFSTLYLPGRYLSQVKRPNQRYIRRTILEDDFALWVLASIWLAPVPGLHVLGLLCLLASLWTVYEQGYVDNDRSAARYETDPHLSPTYGAYVAAPRLMPWLWTAALAAVGLGLLRWPKSPTIGDAAIWAGVLVATALCFLLFNRLDKASRVWPYTGLQLARCAAFVTLVPIVPAAPAVIAAYVAERWIPYYIYRLKKGEASDAWTEIPLHLVRFNFAVVFVLLAMAEGGPSDLLTWSTLALLGFVALKARRQLYAVLIAARRIDRSAAHVADGATQ